MAGFDRRSTPRADAPGDAQTLAGILRAVADDGYTSQFAAREGSRVVCFTCRNEYPAAELTVETLRRLEGASDPDDMLVVAPVACPRCDARGSLVLNYGPEAPPDESEVLLALAEPRRPPDP
jgi:hypothetical protein